MRAFKNFPKEDVCLLCGTSVDGECILVAIDGTEEGNLAQAKPIHTDCISLRYSPKAHVVYQGVME